MQPVVLNVLFHTALNRSELTPPQCMDFIFIYSSYSAAKDNIKIDEGDFEWVRLDFKYLYTPKERRN